MDQLTNTCKDLEKAWAKAVENDRKLAQYQRDIIASRESERQGELKCTFLREEYNKELRSKEAMKEEHQQEMNELEEEKEDALDQIKSECRIHIVNANEGNKATIARLNMYHSIEINQYKSELGSLKGQLNEKNEENEKLSKTLAKEKDSGQTIPLISADWFTELFVLHILVIWLVSQLYLFSQPLLKNGEYW